MLVYVYGLWHCILGIRIPSSSLSIKESVITKPVCIERVMVFFLPQIIWLWVNGYELFLINTVCCFSPWWTNTLHLMLIGNTGDMFCQMGNWRRAIVDCVVLNILLLISLELGIGCNLFLLLCHLVNLLYQGLFSLSKCIDMVKKIATRFESRILSLYSQLYLASLIGCWVSVFFLMEPLAIKPIHVCSRHNTDSWKTPPKRASARLT